MAKPLNEDAAGTGWHLGASSANTHVVSHGGHILPLEDTHLPQRVPYGFHGT